MECKQCSDCLLNSNSLPFPLLEECDHALVWCKQCVAELLHVKSNKQCPICKKEISTERRAFIQAACKKKEIKYSAVQKEDEMLYVCVLSGKITTIKYDQTMKLVTVRNKVAEQCSVPEKKILLMKDNEILEFSKRLLEYNIKAKSVLTAIISPYGQLLNVTSFDNVETDTHGNPIGSDCDLIDDKSMNSLEVAVVCLYTGKHFDKTQHFNFVKPKLELEKKGFKVTLWKDTFPPIAEFKIALKRCCQLWIISDDETVPTNSHLDEIEQCFNSGKGLCLWGDNDPYTTTVNAILARILPNVTLQGFENGEKVLTRQTKDNNPGFVSNHYISTGLINIFEGSTVSTVTIKGAQPYLHSYLIGSAGNLITAYYEHDDKRLIVDGGFTRLFEHIWVLAGTNRFVSNIGAWLVNFEYLLKSGAWKKQLLKKT